MGGKFLGNIILSVVIFALVAFTVNSISASPDVGQFINPPAKVTDRAKELLPAVQLTSFVIKELSGDNMVQGSFALHNAGSEDVKNIVIVCIATDAKGKNLGTSKWVVNETLAAGKNLPGILNEKKYMNDKAVQQQCRIIDLQIAGKPVFTVHRGQVGHQVSDNEHGGGTEASH